MGDGPELEHFGDAQRMIGHRDRAEHTYSRAIELLNAIGSIDTPYAIANLALVLMESGRWPEASEHMQDAVLWTERTGAKKAGLMVNTVALHTDARTHDWSAWDRRVERVRPILKSRLGDPDLAKAALEAARYGESVGQGARMDFAWEVAISQLERLGRASKAKKVRHEWVRAQSLRSDI